MSKLRRKKPKVKMRSYGGGEKIPVVKSGGDFYLADQKYDNLGHGEFSGQTTGKLEGPSKRAIKGKGKKSANVRVTNEKGDPIFLQDTSSMKIKNDYSSMKSMGQAVAKWTSPFAQEGDPVKKTSAVDYAMSQGWGSKDKAGKFTLSKEGAKKFTEWKKSNKDKKPKPTDTETKTKTTFTPTAKTKSKVKPLEKVEKRGGEGFGEMGTVTEKTKVNLPQFSDDVTLSKQRFASKEEADKDRERRDMARMQRAVDSANAPEKLMEGLSRKEKRQMARYDKQAKRGSEESKEKRRATATDITQAIGRAMEAYAGKTPTAAGTSKREELKKKKEDENKNKDSTKKEGLADLAGDELFKADDKKESTTTITTTPKPKATNP